MNQEGVQNNRTESILPERVRRLLHYWFVQYNPLYFFSALCVLFGIFLISQGLVELEWGKGQLLLTASALPATVLVMIPGAEALMPKGSLQWGILILAVGFAALILGIVINWSQGKVKRSA